MDHLAERGLMAYGQRDPATLTDRNSDRVRVLRFLAQHPEGVRQSALCHWVLKGQNPNSYYGFEDLSGDAYERHDEWSRKAYTDDGWTALDGSDDDYQFLNRYVNDLRENTDLVRTTPLNDGETGGRLVAPSLSLLDLISEGTSDPAQENSDLVYDKEFCLKMLQTPAEAGLALTESQKQHLASSLRRYIQRIDDYRLAFDVHLADRAGYQKRRMTKPFATRFNDQGRVDKAFAMLQDSLEWGYERADTAVFATLTTDPKKFDTLLDAIEEINENFHYLTNWLKRSEKDGRPGEKLEYVKVLEFTSKGYPHLHVLFFDPPRCDDGMPWLCDKNALREHWNNDTENLTGQGRIVDLYPLVYRDDLDDLDGARFNAESGFVSWYRYGDHDHSQEWIEDRVRWHQEDGQIDFDGKDENPMQKTAGSYIGKYVSQTYGLLQNNESLNDPDWDPLDADGKSAWWKLALYWATERRFWTPSRRIRQEIKLDADRADIRRGVRDATETSLLVHAEGADDGHALYPDFDRDRARSYLSPIVRDAVIEADVSALEERQELGSSLARVEHIGTYHWEDMPSAPSRRVRHDVVEEEVFGDDGDVALHTTGDRPPPVADAWSN
ncbi:rolling circle replication-associated protein [Halorhabdus salina]|uniref:rolling circle replication-associated protein n=1 Tax=Halorhabdus salina TaxID=2750670 RepID=UPI0015EF89C9|nr:hypothetical protein [Halorhabdus salina]